MCEGPKHCAAGEGDETIALSSITWPLLLADASLGQRQITANPACLCPRPRVFVSCEVGVFGLRELSLVSCQCQCMDGLCFASELGLAQDLPDRTSGAGASLFSIEEGERPGPLSTLHPSNATLLHFCTGAFLLSHLPTTCKVEVLRRNPAYSARVHWHLPPRPHPNLMMPLAA